MEKNQKINCTVTSCKYNNKQYQECSLGQIIVTPIIGCETKEPDESMCSSYKYDEREKIEKEGLKSVKRTKDYLKLLKF